MTSKQFVTSGDITRKLSDEGYDVDLLNVNYVIRRLKVRPMATAGITRLFPVSTVASVRDFLCARERREPQRCGACG